MKITKPNYRVVTVNELTTPEGELVTEALNEALQAAMKKCLAKTSVGGGEVFLNDGQAKVTLTISVKAKKAANGTRGGDFALLCAIDTKGPKWLPAERAVHYDPSIDAITEYVSTQEPLPFMNSTEEV